VLFLILSSFVIAQTPSPEYSYSRAILQVSPGDRLCVFSSPRNFTEIGSYNITIVVRNATLGESCTYVGGLLERNVTGADVVGNVTYPDSTYKEFSFADMGNGNYSIAFNFTQDGTYSVKANASKSPTFGINGTTSYSSTVTRFITRFTIDDDTLTTTQTALFTTHLNNTDSEANVYVNTSEIQFLYNNGTLKEISSLNVPAEAQPLGYGSGLASSFQRTFSSFDDGLYIARLVVNFTYNGEQRQNQSNFTFSVTTSVVVPGPGGGGGGGGFGGGVAAPAVPLEFIQLPILREGEPANPVIVDMTMRNPTAIDREVAISTTGIPQNWVITVNDAGIIRAGETKTHTIAFNIPRDAELGDYLVGVNVNLGGVEGKSNLVLRIKKYPDEFDIPKIFRSVDVNFVDETSVIKQSIVNGDTFRQSIFLYENIPKEVARSSDEITFTTTPTRIIKQDPVVLWILQDVQPQQRQDISYVANGVVSQYEPYVYYLSNEVVSISIRQEEYVKISNLFVSPMSQGSRNNYVAVDFTNSYTLPIDVDASLFSVQRWSIAPETASMTVPAKGTTTVRFNISIPTDVRSGTYTGAVFLRYQNVTSSKDITFVVGGAAVGFVGLDVVGWAILIGIIVLIASYIISRRAYGEEFSKYSFAEDRFKVLKDIKELIKRK
jgi:hypothetical protein